METTTSSPTFCCPECAVALHLIGKDPIKYPLYFCPQCGRSRTANDLQRIAQYNAEEQIRREWESRVAAELEKRKPLSASARNAQFFIERAGIRTLRIAAAAIIGTVAYRGLGRVGEVFNKPFAALSPAELFGGIAGVFGCLVWIVVAAYLGFGPGKSRDQYDKENADRIRAEVESKLEEDDRQMQRRQWMHGKAHVIGRFVRTLGRGN